MGALFGSKRFSQEYLDHVDMSNPSWRRIRRMTMALSLGRDAILPCFRATQCDHLSYRRLGRELPLVDLVPLSRGTHRIVTLLRSLGLAMPVNLLLRLAYGSWIAAWIYGAAMIGQILGIVHGVPWPSDLANGLTHWTAAARPHALEARDWLRAHAAHP